jgi:hypothetical protein
MALLRAHIEAGFDPAAFWCLSPRLYLHQMRAAAQRRRHEAEARAWLAWHTGALARDGVKLPDAAEFIDRAAGRRAPVAPQGPEVLQAMCDALAAAWGARPGEDDEGDRAS